MLHEILLALSGHPSPLFSDDVLDNDSDALPLSPSEKALLQSIGQLSDLHRGVRRHVDHIAATHPSMVCRAVATSIQQTHLGRFQDAIVQVESKILTKDASLVGAYDIVPLAAVVSEFDVWQRRMAWYWDMACLMLPLTSSKASSGCTAAMVIDRLRAEQQTGFNDIEAVAIELGNVAETAWLRQIASWVAHGSIPRLASSDFFIRIQDGDQADDVRFVKDKDLLPKFVTPSTAASILFIGKSLHQVRNYERNARTSQSPVVSESEVAAQHLRHLSSLALPIVPTQLSRAISAIRLSLSQCVLQHLLPMESTFELLSCLRDFFLLSRGEFASTVIDEAEKRLISKQEGLGRLLQQDPVKALQSLSIKDAELHQTLSAVWKHMAALDREVEDNALEFASKHVSLTAPPREGSRPSTSDSADAALVDVSPVPFNDLLFPSATILTIRITPPMDLFVSPREVETYSAINAYLLSIRRAHQRLSGLWRRTGARRGQTSSSGESDASFSDIASRMAKRNLAMRKVWATCSAAIFLIAETSAYLSGEVIRDSWQHFESWLRQPISGESARDIFTNEDASHSDVSIQRDPETMSAGHRSFLASLTYALLLSDVPYTKELRSLLGNIDNLIAFFNSLLDVQQKLDLEHDAGGATGYTSNEEQRVALELDRARKKVDSDLKSVLARLRQLDRERIGSARYLDVRAGEGEYEPAKTGGIDRLLMKLEFGRVADERFDIV